VDIALPQPFPDVHLTRSEFEDLIRPNLQRSVDLMARTIHDAGFDPRQLAGVYLVGGSSRIPLVARLIQQGLGVTPTTLDQPETSVVTGALYLPLGSQAPAAAGPVVPQTGMPSGPSSGPVPAQGGYPAMPPFQPGYPTGPQVATPMGGYPSGGQPVVANPLPQLNVRSAVPTSQLRPLDAPMQSPLVHSAPPSGPTMPHRPAPPLPPSGKGGRRGLLIGGGAVLLVAVLTVVAILYATKGDGNGTGGNPQASNGSTTSSTGTSTGTLEEAFDDDVIREYVKPTFPQITKCQRGFTDSNGGSSSSQLPPVPYTTTCFYANGVQAAFAKGANKEAIETFRSVIATSLPDAGLNQKKSTWPHGEIDEYTGTSDLVALFWYDDRQFVYAFVTVPKSKLSISKLRDWWQADFGNR
jgi:Hsp70 protein